MTEKQELTPAVKTIKRPKDLSEAKYLITDAFSQISFAGRCAEMDKMAARQSKIENENRIIFATRGAFKLILKKGDLAEHFVILENWPADSMILACYVPAGWRHEAVFFSDDALLGMLI